MRVCESTDRNNDVEFVVFSLMQRNTGDDDGGRHSIHGWGLRHGFKSFTPKLQQHRQHTKIPGTHFGANISASHGTKTTLEQKVNTMSSVDIPMIISRCVLRARDRERDWVPGVDLGMWELAWKLVGASCQIYLERSSKAFS